MTVVEIGQQNAYRQHRCRVKQAKAFIDDEPPLLHVGNFTRFTRMKEDVETLIARHRDNARLLVAMNKVVRTKGAVDSFRTAENSFATPFNRLQQKQQWLQEMCRENLRIGKMILNAKPEINTWLDEKFKRKSEQKTPPAFQYPTLVMQKYSNINLPSDSLQVRKLLRPKIWFNLEIKDVRPLGRIIIELYTEAAPQVVLEFVHLCFGQQRERLNFIRLFPRLWLEGNLKVDNNTLMSSNIEYDKRCLDHGDQMGILSFNVKHVFCAPKSVINFSISFKALSVCNGRRVGFGRVCEGLRILKSIEDYGNKNGKLYKEIILTDCGVLL